jgi:hypothetical protein
MMYQKRYWVRHYKAITLIWSITKFIKYYVSRCIWCSWFIWNTSNEASDNMSEFEVLVANYYVDDASQTAKVWDRNIINNAHYSCDSVIFLYDEYLSGTQKWFASIKFTIRLSIPSDSFCSRNTSCCISVCQIWL